MLGSFKRPSIAHYASRASVVVLVFTGARRLLFPNAQCIMGNTGSLTIPALTHICHYATSATRSRYYNMRFSSIRQYGFLLEIACTASRC